MLKIVIYYFKINQYKLYTWLNHKYVNNIFIYLL